MRENTLWRLDTSSELWMFVEVTPSRYWLLEAKSFGSRHSKKIMRTLIASCSRNVARHSGKGKQFRQACWAVCRLMRPTALKIGPSLRKPAHYADLCTGIKANRLFVQSSDYLAFLKHRQLPCSWRKTKWKIHWGTFALTDPVGSWFCSQICQIDIGFSTVNNRVRLFTCSFCRWPIQHRYLNHNRTTEVRLR